MRPPEPFWDWTAVDYLEIFVTLVACLAAVEYVAIVVALVVWLANVLLR